MNYHDYLQLDKVLSAQSLQSEKEQLPAHDEMLFIVIHQAYELWFKQLHYEVDSMLEIMERPSLNDNSPDLEMVVHRLGRCVAILRLLVHQIDIMETMTPMDFLDFRDMLRPASGFQSWQFKELEAKLGLRFENRHGKEYYTSQLREEHVVRIKNAEQKKSLFHLVNTWLERMPFFEEDSNWTGFLVHDQSAGLHPFWTEYRYRYEHSLAEGEKSNLQLFDQLLLSDTNNERSLSSPASRAALFITLYRRYPMLQLPFRLLNGLLEIDEQLSSWRYRHMNMVHRMIGMRIGTGGSSGKDYLKAAADRHYIFRELAGLNSLLIETRKLPALTTGMERRLGFLESSRT